MTVTVLCVLCVLCVVVLFPPTVTTWCALFAWWLTLLWQLVILRVAFLSHHPTGPGLRRCVALRFCRTFWLFASVIAHTFKLGAHPMRRYYEGCGSSLPKFVPDSSMRSMRSMRWGFIFRDRDCESGALAKFGRWLIFGTSQQPRNVPLPTISLCTVTVTVTVYHIRRPR